MAGLIHSWKAAAHRLKRDTYTLYFAYRDPRTPWYARALTAVVVAYALSPIDLIPDFVPVLGYLDDLVIVPLGVALAVKMIPPAVIEQARNRAETELASRPRTWIGAAIIVAAWLVTATLIGLAVARRLAG